jgi:uncharacterized protein YjgD (DUF1641 family)
MAKPTDSYPESATHGARRREAGDGEGEAALRRALDARGESLAAAVERTDELDDALTTAILVAATADEAEVKRITDSAANLVEAADGLTTDGAAALATDLGENADDLSDALDTVLALQRDGTLDDFATLAGALSTEQVEALSATLSEEETDLAAALDLVLDLQRSGDLEELVGLARTFSVLDVDAETARGLNELLGAVGEAERESEPVGLIGAVGQLRTADARAGLGYLVAILKALGRRVGRE